MDPYHLFLIFVVIAVCLLIFRSFRTSARYLASQQQTQNLLKEQQVATEAFQAAMLLQDERQTAALERIANTLESREPRA